MKTAVIYARYSSDSQTEQSIEGQLRVCEEYAKNNDILVLHTYIDRAMTGTNDNRPDFQRMIKDSFRKEWNYVIVYKLDRFSRNKYETAIHKKTLKDNGVKVMSATEYIPDTPEAIIFESMLEGYAEYYSAELSQKIRRGNNESRRKGNLTGGHVPYGYKNVNKKAVIVDEEAEVIRYIYAQYSAGVCVKDIIAKLTSKGIYFYGKPFVTNTVYKILRNERYSGVYHFNGEEFRNIYPPIVSAEVFEKVKNKIEANQYGKRSEDVEYILREKAICGYCGKSMVGENGTARNGERRYYYACRGRKNNLNGCNKKAIRKDILENIVIDTIIDELNNPNRINEFVKGIMREQERQFQNNLTLNRLINEKLNTENAIQKIVNAIERGVITNTTTKRLKSLEEKQEILEQQIIVERDKASALLKENEIRTYYLQALRLEPKLLISYLIKRIVVYDDKVEIYFNNPLRTSPDNIDRGFSYIAKIIKISYKIPRRSQMIRLKFDVVINIF